MNKYIMDEKAQKWREQAQMYREVLEYIRELGEERDLSPDRQGEVRECMDGIAKEICGMFKSPIRKRSIKQKKTWRKKQI